MGKICRICISSASYFKVKDKKLDVNMNENNSQSFSKENLPKKVEIDFNKGNWISNSSNKSKIKTSKTSNKSKSRKKELESPGKQETISKYDLTKSPIAKKQRIFAESSKKIFKTRKYLSPSAKIDSKLPKIDDLLRARKESEKLKEIDKLIKKSSTQFLKELNQSNVKIEEKPEIIEKKDCKHLSLQQLERRFRKDIKFLECVFNGTVYSERHELFQKQLLQGNNTLKEDLRVSESFGAFTSEQLVHIVTLFREKFDNGNKYKYSDYYFKVLLPEYTLKLFMDCHRMSNEAALEYLKNVPVPDLFGLMP